MPAVVDHCRHQVWGCAHTPSVGNYSTLPTNLHAQLAKFKGTACLTTAVQLSQYLPFVSNWKSGRVTLHKFQGLSVMYSCFTINVSLLSMQVDAVLDNWRCAACEDTTAKKNMIQCDCCDFWFHW